MKKAFILFLVFVAGCVKDPSDISPNQLFDVKIDGLELEKANVIADNSLKYKVDIQASDGLDIENDKQVTVSVSDGTVAAISSLTSATSNQITVTLEGGKGVFYYMPGKNPQPSALLSTSLLGLSQVYKFSIGPSEPKQIELDHSAKFPKTTDNVDLTAFLIKDVTNNSMVSNNLKIYFEARKNSTADSIEGFIPAPSFANSMYNESTGLVSAKTILSTNKKPGKIVVIAKYIKADSSVVADSVIVEFTK